MAMGGLYGRRAPHGPGRYDEGEARFHLPSPRIGFNVSTPAKSLSLSVTTMQPLASAVAATMVSSALRERSCALPAAISRAQAWAAFSSNLTLRVGERLRLLPEGSRAVSTLLNAAADALVEGGRSGIFTPMFFFLARKPPRSGD